MRIEFVNHSSVVVESGSTRLICDPWLEGRAFNDGWALLSPTRFRYEDFERITHVWFSHEHPDHFSPPCLKRIPEELRSRITVLYQKSADGKVVEYCRKLGFGAVRELELGQWTPIAEGFEVYCDAWREGDSYLGVRTPEAKLLNLNDCMVTTPEDCRRVTRAVGPIDVLLTQFSISAWDGNAEDFARRRGGGQTMLERTVMQGHELAPRYLIPFASFIWFCHEENHYMNDGFVGIEEVHETLVRELEATPLVLYPGDAWTFGEPWSNQASVAAYRHDQQQIPTRQRMPIRAVTEGELVEAAAGYRRLLLERSSPLKLRVALARQSYRHLTESEIGGPLERLSNLLRLRTRPARIHVWDQDRSYLFDLDQGLRSAALPRDECDVALGADSLLYAFRFLWGGMTLLINGRFQELRPGGREPLFRYFYAADHLNGGGEVRWGSLMERLRRAPWRRGAEPAVRPMVESVLGDPEPPAGTT